MDSVNNIYVFLQPALPNTARCAICGEGESEESNPSAHSLMECSVCSQIAHRQCIKVIWFRHSEGYELNTLFNYCIVFVLPPAKLHFMARFAVSNIITILFQDPGEGKINKDLPSCWECPKCYPGKDSEASEVTNAYLLNLTCPLFLFLCFQFTPFLFTAKFSLTISSTGFHMFDVDTYINNDTLSSSTYPCQSSSDEESGESEGSLPPSKLAYREGIGVGEGVRRGRRSRPPSRPTAPPPSQKLLLQHQQNRKRASALELRLKKRVKWGYHLIIV